jgi:hypothetical protein
MTSHQDLLAAIVKARDHAKELLRLLETQRHPETARSSSLYLALVSIQKQLKDRPPSPQIVAELKQLVTMCEGRLAPIKPLVEQALAIASAGGRTTV